MPKLLLHMPLTIAEGANPICRISPISLTPVVTLSMSPDGLMKMPHRHAPVVAHKPLDLRWANEFCKGHLKWLSERFYNVGANIIHGTLLDEGFKEPQAQTN